MTYLKSFAVDLNKISSNLKQIKKKFVIGNQIKTCEGVLNIS